MSKKVVKKTPRKSQSWSLYKGMQIYKRPRSDFFYGCLRINNQYFKKSLGTVPEMPDRLKKVMNGDERFSEMNIDLEKIKDFIRSSMV